MRGIKTILKGLTDQQRNDLQSLARRMVRTYYINEAEKKIEEAQK